MSSEPAVSSVASSDPRFPVGKHQRPEVISADDREYATEAIALLPENLRNALAGLNEAQIDTPYREGGWTIRQVVHHIADSHMHAYARIRFALTENNPTILPYNEQAWAVLHDALTAPVEWSLELIESLHARWVMLLNHLTQQQWQRVYVHPENGSTSVEQAVLMYAWHSRHHTAHITHARVAKGW